MYIIIINECLLEAGVDNATSFAQTTPETVIHKPSYTTINFLLKPLPKNSIKTQNMPQQSLTSLIFNDSKFKTRFVECLFCYFCFRKV